MSLFDSQAAGTIAARPYQTEALWGSGQWPGAFKALESQTSTLIDLPTGTGKTVTFGLAAKHWLETGQTESVLVLAHMRKLITQGRDELAGILGFTPEIEMGDQWANPRAQCVVASVQTLFNEKRRARFDPSRFGRIIVDEAHHMVPTSKTYWGLREHFSLSKWLGVSATLQRGDGKALGAAWESVSYALPIADAIDGGWLVDVEQEFIKVDHLDLSAVGTVAGDFNQGQLGAAMTHDERTSWEIAAAVLKHCQDEPTLVFSCPRGKDEPVGQGQQIADALNTMRPGSAVFLTGETDEGMAALQIARFERREFPYLIGCSLFTEGFNCPIISRIVMARPTKSIAYYMQAIGRGTRTLRGLLRAEHNALSGLQRREIIAASAKPKVIVYDFVGNSAKHKLISCVDIFVGKMGQQSDMRDKVRAVSETLGKPVSPRKLAAQIQADENEAARVKARVQTTAQRVNPFEMSDRVNRVKKKERKDGKAPASVDQLEWITKNGGVLPKHGELTTGEAGAMIADIQKRWKLKLASPKMEKTLKSLGVHGKDIPKVHAKAMLDLGAAAGWPWGRMDWPTSNQLGIRAVDDGYRLTVEMGGQKYAVGGVYQNPEEVRRAYVGMARQPEAAVA